MEDKDENVELSNEKKDLVLKNTQEYADDLNNLEELHDALGDTFDSSDEESDERKEEKYDLRKDRKNIRKNGRVTNRHLGYHRRYLLNDAKISNIILLVIFIVLSIFVVIKFAVPDKTKTSGNNVVETAELKFGGKIVFEITPTVNEDSLLVKVTVKNNEEITVKFTPETIKLNSKGEIYMPILTNEDKQAVSVEGLKSGESTTFNLKYNLKKENVANSTLETIFVGGSDSCAVISSLGL